VSFDVDFVEPPPGLQGGGVFLVSGCFRFFTAGDTRLAAVEFVGQGIFSSCVSLNLFTISLNFAACAGADGVARELTAGEEPLRGVWRYGDT